MKNNQLEITVGQVVSQLTMDLIQKGEVLLKAENGGLNHATQILYFTDSTEKGYNAIFTKREFDYGSYTGRDIATVNVYKGIISKDDFNNGFIDTVFEKTEKELVKTIKAIVKPSGKTAKIFDNEEEAQEVMNKRKERMHAEEDYWKEKLIGEKKLESVKGFKRGLTTVSRNNNGYILKHESGKTETVNFVKLNKGA